jgi:hypothetical protein
MLRFNGDFVIILNIPHVSLKNVEYEIPSAVHDLESTRLLIHRTDDEGPITKLLPSLRNPIIDDQATVVVCDDDIPYNWNTFNLLASTVEEYPTCVATPWHRYHPMRLGAVEGVKAFAFRKCTLVGMLALKIPPCCLRIDDDVVQAYIAASGIEIKPVSYGHLGIAAGLDEVRYLTSTNYGWPELRADDRTDAQTICWKKISKQVKKI